MAHLAPLAAERVGGAPPCERRLIESIHALQLLVFPSLRAAGELGESLSHAVVAGFVELIAQTHQVCGMKDDPSVADRFFEQIPATSALLALDVEAAFRGDPAAQSPLEVIVCYPGIRALFVYRFAHVLDSLGVPLLPRMMCEYAHRDTGIDIHPSAQIGSALFIDHGTGVVIGQTAVIGDRCRIYQGVTLGAKSFDRESDGTMRRGYKRHPTLESDVVVYAGATILGGDTVIGKGAVIAGGVFLTRSVPAGHLVTGPRSELRVLSMDASL